jgi:hypothetical protein
MITGSYCAFSCRYAFHYFAQMKLQEPYLTDAINDLVSLSIDHAALHHKADILQCIDIL